MQDGHTIVLVVEARFSGAKDGFQWRPGEIRQRIVLDIVQGGLKNRYFVRVILLRSKRSRFEVCSIVLEAGLTLLACGAGCFVHRSMYECACIMYKAYVQAILYVAACTKCTCSFNHLELKVSRYLAWLE